MRRFFLLAALAVCANANAELIELGNGEGVLEESTGFTYAQGGITLTAATSTAELAELIQAQAAEVDLAPVASDEEPEWDASAEDRIAKLTDELLELEYTLIPHGLHVVGEPPNAEERTDLLMAVAEGMTEGCTQQEVSRDAIATLVDGGAPALALQKGGMAVTDENLKLMSDLAGYDRGATCCARRRSCPPGATCTASTPSGCRASTRSRTA